MLLILSLFRIRRTAASSYARKPAQGAPGLNRPAAYPLRPMMGGAHPRPSELSGFPGPFNLSAFLTGSAGL